ncbi:hypothetical protein AB4298_18420 [Shewanella sp. 10N.261.52.F9]|uniref:hypothetical protein n=1 Tax=Shewanella sp. 10N.261.52.F9 TaxID=3229684 RepID=UPI00354CDF29
MLTRNEFEKFQCDEYLAEEYRAGFYHEESYLQLILAVENAYVGENGSYLVIGHAGVDGIEFCYQLCHKGIWAYYPIDKEFVFMASTIKNLILGWRNGDIKV